MNPPPLFNEEVGFTSHLKLLDEIVTALNALNPIEMRASHETLFSMIVNECMGRHYLGHTRDDMDRLWVVFKNYYPTFRYVVFSEPNYYLLRTSYPTPLGSDLMITAHYVKTHAG